MKRSLVLASRSAIRARMLQNAGVEIDIRPSPLNEVKAKQGLEVHGLGPRDLAARLARLKALAVPAVPDEIVLGADQTLELDGEVLDKPGDLARLREQLNRLQGRAHLLHSAAALVRDGELLWSQTASVMLRMRAIEPGELESYVATEGPNVLDCVGGYRLEGVGVQLFEAVEGEYFAVLGLPLLGILNAVRVIGSEAAHG